MIIDVEEYEKCREKAKSNLTIFDGYTKAKSVLSKYENVCVSVSGGKDSDLCVDIVSHLDKEKKARYIWFNTGLEYKATKDHLTYLEQKYDITIERIKAIKPIPLSCKEYGVPFLSKYVSEMIERLQNHGFQFEDDDFDTLKNRYSNCVGGLNWWTNARDVTSYGYSQFNISYNKYLKEFMLVNPPDFPISSKCCTYAKKKVAHSIQTDLMITGIRKAEAVSARLNINPVSILRTDSTDRSFGIQQRMKKNMTSFLVSVILTVMNFGVLPAPGVLAVHTIRSSTKKKKSFERKSLRCIRRFRTSLVSRMNIPDVTEGFRKQVKKASLSQSASICTVSMIC